MKTLVAVFKLDLHIPFHGLYLVHFFENGKCFVGSHILPFVLFQRAFIELDDGFLPEVGVRTTVNGVDGYIFHFGDVLIGTYQKTGSVFKK